jgi:imidazolonepropionase-like amidohydrolase
MIRRVATISKQAPWFAGILLALAAACAPQAEEAPTSSDAIVIDGAQLWDGTGAPVVGDSVMVVEGDRIQAVGPRDAVAIPEGATVIDARGQTLMPGIINGHAHLGMVKGLVESTENYDRENILSQLEQYARYGVTTVASLGLDSGSGPMFEIQGPAGPGETPRATVLTAGLGFTGKGGYPGSLPQFAGVPREVDTPEEARQNVRELAGEGVDYVKIWVDDHFGRYPEIRPDLYAAIIDEAHAQGLPVFAHVFYLSDAKGLVEAGVDGLAHTVRDQEVDDELIQAMLANDVFILGTLTREESTAMYAEPPAFLDDPFFTRWADPDVIAQLKDPAYGAGVRGNEDYQRNRDQFAMAKINLKKLYDAGVRIGFGTDSGPPGRFQGFFEHRELEIMAGLGIPVEDVLRIATSGEAEILGIGDETGSLQAGKRADFLLLDANPLENIRNTRTIRSVWIGGREVELD